MAVTVPLILDLRAVIEPAPDGPVVALVLDGKVIERKPLSDYLACPTCGHQLTEHPTHRGDSDGLHPDT